MPNLNDIIIEQQTVEYVLCSDLFVRSYKRAGDTRLEVASATHLADVYVDRLKPNCLCNEHSTHSFCPFYSLFYV